MSRWEKETNPCVKCKLVAKVLKKTNPGIEDVALRETIARGEDAKQEEDTEKSKVDSEDVDIEKLISQLHNLNETIHLGNKENISNPNQQRFNDILVGRPGE